MKIYLVIITIIFLMLPVLGCSKTSVDSSAHVSSFEGKSHGGMRFNKSSGKFEIDMVSVSESHLPLETVQKSILCANRVMIEEKKWDKKLPEQERRKRRGVFYGCAQEEMRLAKQENRPPNPDFPCQVPD
jgi:hypothetical protein